MIKIGKLNKDTFEVCSGCHCGPDKKAVYKLKIGLNERQTAGINLCFDCLTELGNMAYDIYREED